MHELGHYVMCRRYGVAATLPYFLPSPFPNLIGTFGALIRIKEPIRDKRALLDIGAAGPLAGFFAALPFLFYGVTRAKPITAISGDTGTVLFDYPMMVRLAQDWTGSGRYTSASSARASGFHGGLVRPARHGPESSADRAARRRARAARGCRPPPAAGLADRHRARRCERLPRLDVDGLRSGHGASRRVRHPPVEDDDEPLDFGRTLIALACLAVFLLCFSLVPITITS